MDHQDGIVRVQLTFDHDYQFVATFPDIDAAALPLDEAPPLGGGQGPNPVALLATAIGNCLASSLLFCTRKARVSIDELEVRAEAHVVRNPAGRYRVSGVTVTLEPKIAGTDTARLERCREIFEEFCIVTESVRQGIDVQVAVSPHATQETAVG